MTTARSSPPDPVHPGFAPLARLVELALVVPLEVSSRLIEAVPVVADKVPSAAARVRREIVLARFLGKLAVDQGVRELRARLAHDDDTAPDLAPTDASSDTPEASEPPAEAPTESMTTIDAPEAATLALADYDHLSSAQIVSKLDGLDAAERDTIEAYEQAGRHRRTILGKLDQLRSSAAIS